MDGRVFIGCSASAVAAYGQTSKQRTVALLFDSLVSPFWVASIDRMKLESARRRWSVLEAVSNQDDNKQYQQVRSMLQRGVDGIIIVHTDNKAVIPAVRAANLSGVPMVHFNRAPASSDAYLVAIVADNRRLMRETSAALVDLARRRGGRYEVAVLIGDLGDANAVDRRDGFQKTFDRNPDIVEVVARIATDWNADKAFSGLSNALQAHPGLNMLITSSDFMTPQSDRAGLRAAGKWHKAGDSEHVLIAGFDGDDNGYSQLAAGYFDVDGVQSLDYEVQLSFEALERMWAGEMPRKVLVDPGFVIGRESLLERRGQMWGYRVWKGKSMLAGTGTAASSTAIEPSPNAVVNGQAPTIPQRQATTRGEWAGLGIIGAALLFAQTLFSADTLHEVLLAMLPLVILVVGQTPVLLIGQIDLSMTAIMAMSSVLGTSVMTRCAHNLSEPWTTALGVVACLGLGLFVGLFNGLCNAILPDAIATVRFDTREALDAAFARPDLKADLLRTRNQFASALQLVFVDENAVVGEESKQ
jgi:ABC-type sugar transport system substrate-binding protein